MPDSASLPALQTCLDGLAVGQQLAIPVSTSVHLFGASEAGVRSLWNFAVGHGCDAEERDQSVVFVKRKLSPA